MAKRSRVIVRDLGYFEILEQLQAMGGTHITVGIHGDAKERALDADFTNAQIGGVHEFGSVKARIPQRSFIRSTMDSRRKDLNAVVFKAMGLVADGKRNNEDAAGIIGLFAENAIKSTITKGDPEWAPLSPFTLEAKKPRTKILIDSAQMRNAVTHKVVTGPRPRGTV